MKLFLLINEERITDLTYVFNCEARHDYMWTLPQYGGKIEVFKFGEKLGRPHRYCLDKEISR